MQETLFLNARIPRLDAAGPAGTWLLAHCGHISALDPGGESAPQRPGIQEVDLRGRTVIPGPVDAHCHLVSYGMQRRREADLRGARSLAEIRARLEAHATLLDLRDGDGRWLLGRGFDQEILAERRWPNRDDLDSIASGRPLRITRICGHALVANTHALHLAGVSSSPHGEFPAGVATEERMTPLNAAVPAPTDAEWREAALWAAHEAARVGFVGVHSLMAHEREIRALVALDRDGELPVRVQMQPPYAMLDTLQAAGIQTGFGSDYLTFGAIKLFSDGSLGARTAALGAPYSDDPRTAGELIYGPDELARRVQRIYDAGFQVCTHAIGDRAMAATLDAMEAGEMVRQGNPSARRFPPRIEHASLVNPALVERMRSLGVVAAVQPQFARSDYWAPERLGVERARGCYAFRTLWEGGVPLGGSTDCPVEPLDALAALGQMVSRPPWSPDEVIPLEAALRIFSEGSYQLQGAPPGAGRLAVGQRADFVALEQDPWRVPAAEVECISVAVTVVGGIIRHLQ